MSLDRIRLASLHDKVISAEEASAFIEDGMTVGMSGFTRAGEAKAVPLALVKRAHTNPLKITLITGASLGNDLDKQLTEAGVLARRLPFQVDNTLRKAINNGEVMFIDQHLSETVEQMRNFQLKKPDVAIIEAVAITEDGGIIPTTSVGNSASFAIFAEKVIVEINTNLSPAFEGLHDIYIPTYRPTRQPIPLTQVDERIGTHAINIDPAKIVGIVINKDLHDSPSTVTAPDDETQGIADHLIAFFEKEVAEERLPKNLGPLQAGIGSIANAVLTGLKDSNFEDLVMYSEVLQDCTFELIDAGKMKFASGSSITLSAVANLRYDFFQGETVSQTNFLDESRCRTLNRSHRSPPQCQSCSVQHKSCARSKNVHLAQCLSTLDDSDQPDELGSNPYGVLSSRLHQESVLRFLQKYREHRLRHFLQSVASALAYPHKSLIRAY